MTVSEWVKRDLGQLLSGLVQTLVFVSLGTWYVNARLGEIDTRDALHEQSIANLGKRVDHVEGQAANYRNEVLAEVRGMRNELRNDLIRLEDKIEHKFAGRPPP